jgi:hypothetical protein
MTDPIPGEAFEYRGLRWEPNAFGHGYHSLLGGLTTLSHTLSGWIVSARRGYFASAREAIDWAIRTCPAAKCGSCEHAEPAHNGKGNYCYVVSDRIPDSGFCHEWELKH